MPDRHFLIALSAVPGIGPVRMRRLLAAFGMPEAAWRAPLADDEDPVPHGFTASRLRWRSNGLAFNSGDAHLRANLDLRRPTAGGFHPHFPAAIDVTAQGTHLRGGAAVVTWTEPIADAYLDVEVASLTPQTLMVGTTPYALPAGGTTITAPVALDQPTRIAGQLEVTALQRLRLRAAPLAPPGGSDSPRSSPAPRRGSPARA